MLRRPKHSKIEVVAPKEEEEEEEEEEECKCTTYIGQAMSCSHICLPVVHISLPISHFMLNQPQN